MAAGARPIDEVAGFLVARFGPMRDGCEMDRAAQVLARPGLPVPEVLAVGEVLGARSRSRDARKEPSSRSHPGRGATHGTRGRCAPRRSAGRVAETCCRRARVVASIGQSAWTSTWGGWLLAGLADDATRPVSGWRGSSRRTGALDDLFETAAARMRELRSAPNDATWSTATYSTRRSVSPATKDASPRSAAGGSALRSSVDEILRVEVGSPERAPRDVLDRLTCELADVYRRASDAPAFNLVKALTSGDTVWRRPSVRPEASSC